MRNTNKKGFTIVELVIVVAVIAILAAVLIPTFSGVIAKAKLSADKKAVQELNTYIAMEEADTFAKAISALEKHKVNTDNLAPISAGYSFVWNAETKQFALVETEENTEDINETMKNVEVTVSTADYLALAVANGSKSIKLDANVEIKEALNVAAGENVVVDLNGKTLTVTGYSDKANGSHYYALNVTGNLTIKNGTINARGVQTYSGANLVIEDGVTVNAIDNNGGACVYIREGSNVTINGGNFESLACKSELTGGSVIINDGGKLTINGGNFTSKVNGPYVVNHKSGETVINGGTFKAVRGVVSAVGGTVSIAGGTFTKTDLDNKAGYELYVAGGAKVTVTGDAKFTNEIFYGYTK